jgi:hypothetical protein
MIMSYNWELAPSGSKGATRYGAMWTTSPAVSITKHGCTFNNIFVKLWLKDATQVLVYIDQGHEALGIKPVLRGNETPDACILHFKKRHTGSFIGLKAVPSTFPQHIGKAFLAHRASDDLIIRVPLVDSNLVE